MLCMCTHISIQTFRIPWTVVHLQCFAQAEKISFATCVAESEFLPVWKEYHQFFLRDKSSFFFPFSFLPSPSCRLGASVEHTAAEAMRGMNLRAGGILLFTVLGLVLGSLQGSVNTSCHMNVNISGWLQMRSQGVSGCFGNQPVPLFLPVANNRVLLGADHCLWTKGLQKLLCGKWWVGWKKGVKW